MVAFGSAMGRADGVDGWTPDPNASPWGAAAPMAGMALNFHEEAVRKAIADYQAKAGQAILAKSKEPIAAPAPVRLPAPDTGTINGKPVPTALTANPASAVDNAANAIGAAATQHQTRLDSIYKDLNALQNPWDTQGETYKAALGRALDDVTRGWAGSTQKTLDTMAQRGQGGGVGASLAAAQMGRQRQQALSDAQSGMATAALQGSADFGMRKADALSRLAAGDLGGAQGAAQALANLGLSWDGQKFTQKMAQGAEDRAQGRYGLELQGLATSVGMGEAQLYEQLQGMPARLAQLNQATQAGQLTLARAKAKFPFEIQMLETQMKQQGMALDEAVWARDRRDLVLGLNFLASVAGPAAKVITGGAA